MSIDINRLKQSREDILKAEIGALLFNLGKTHIGIGNWRNYFPKKEQIFSNYKDYYEQNHFEQELENINSQLKKFIFDTEININEQKEKWVEYFKGDVSESDIVKKVFFRGCENINSGIDKGSPKEQIQGELWISNAFGGYLDSVKDYNFDDRRKCFFVVLNEKCKKNNWYNNPDWKKLRDFILANVKSWYLNLLSDNRFPVNDVTLWDQAYMSATMFKAAFAGMVLNTRESQNYISNPQSIKWQILGVQYDKLALAEKALKVPIINWYREAAKELDEKIKEIIEIDYPLGNEIYRDETGIYFLVPEGIKLEDIDCIKSKILSEFKCEFNDEIYPYIELTKASRGTMNLTALLEKAKENFLKADYSIKKSINRVESNAIGICQICKNNFVTKKEKDDIPMCDVCKGRKKGRIDEWLKRQDDETIWIDEIADSNNRIALVTLKFELMEWLNGDLLSSLLVRRLEINDTFSDLVMSLKNDFKQINKKINKTILKNYKGDIPNQSLKNLIKTLLLERTIGSKWEKFLYKKLNDWNEEEQKPLKVKIDFEKRTIHWEKLTNNDLEFLSKVILQFLLRKNPSPARLRRRIWESTEWFFDEVKNNILDSIKAYRTKENFVQKVTDFKNLENEIIEQEYKRYFSIIDPTPISWQFIIPTNKVKEFIDKVQKLYYKNFKYVNGKLPLHIGIVVQNSKSPLYIGIKALRNIRRDIKSWNEIKKEGSGLLEDLSCYFELNEINNNAENFYSLYETDNSDYDFYLLPSGKGVKKYNPKDEFVIYPNTFDFEFLDTNTRRNDIYYQNGKRTVKLKKNRPYNWSEWKYFKKFRDDFKDKSNKLQTLVSLIYSKMEDWSNDEESFKKFMESTFKKEGLDIKVYGIKDYSFEEMKKFLDMFEFWHTTLKEI